MLEPSLLTIFIADSVDRHMLGSIIPAPSYYALDPLFIIIFGLIFSRIWHRLGQSKKDISITSKFSLAIVLMGVAYLVFCIGIINANHTTHLVHSFWIILAYVFLTIGELLIVPIGLSMVGILFPKGKEGLGMGVWQLFTGFAAVISGYLANLTATPLSHNPASANAAFFSTFFKIGLSAVAAGLLLMMLFFLINPYLNKLIGDKRGAA
jgi:POT family proton-dependent oligopeptide transporter